MAAAACSSCGNALTPYSSATKSFSPGSAAATRVPTQKLRRRTTRLTTQKLRRRYHFRVSASNEDPSDTRIHWKSDDEGWIGDVWSQPEPIRGRRTVSPTTASPVTRRELMPLLIAAEESYYTYMGLRPDAPAEEVKAAFRRLSKEYHPDTTSLPVVVAAEKFMRLREAYTVLSDNNQRQGYDLKLAQEVVDSGTLGYRDSFFHAPSSSIGGPNSSFRRPKESLSKVDKLDGENMDLSSQAQTGLLFDVFALGIAVIAILYAIYVKGK